MSEGDKPPKPVKLSPQLHMKLAVIATFKGSATNHYLEELLAPIIEQQFAEVIRLAAKGLPS